MDKPVISLKTDSTSDRTTLQKNLPQHYAEGNFNDLIDYMTESREDEFNPGYESENERRLAGRIRNWVNEVRKNPDNASINLCYVDENEQLSQPINLESRVSDHMGEMLKRKRVIREDRPVEYDEAELVLSYQPHGGPY